ncbi:MAG: phage terminase large subunit [Bacteriovoracaceae bacterium]
MSGSTPNFSEFDPSKVKYQAWVIALVCQFWNYKKWGLLTILLSGSFGSAKSIIIAHLAVYHCLKYPKALFLLGRRSMPDLKSTIFKKILEHIDEELIEGVDYVVNKTSATITFSNGSMIESISWADGNYFRARSKEASSGAIEEATESDGDAFEAIKEFTNRLNRLSHVPQAFLIMATNPDDPRHPVHKEYIEKGFKFQDWYKNYFLEKKINRVDGEPFKIGKKFLNRIVFYSVTFDNPFLDKNYIQDVMATYSKLEIQRFIYGKWIAITGKGVYHAYDPAKNYLSETEYVVNPAYPIHISHDFNISRNKPMSACAQQYINGQWHTFKEWVVLSLRTGEIMEEIGASGVLDHGCTIVINGDGCGDHNDTRNIQTDYDIIEKFYADYRDPQGRTISWIFDVPLKNPPIKARHNIANGKLCNAHGEINWFIYKGCPNCDQAMAQTRLKKGSNYIEDDSDFFQHVGTAMTYSSYSKYIEELIEQENES